MIRPRMTLMVVAAALSVLLLPFSNAAAQSLPPEVGDAVLIATNSIQIDRDTVVVSGGLVVNNASSSTVLGELDLSLDQLVTTPAGYVLKANSIDIDGGAVVNSAVFYNTLQNNGTINGVLFTPLSLPVFSSLPQLLDGTAGTQNITIGANQSQTLGAGSYGALSVGRDATVRLSGGTYVFSSITTDRGGSIAFDAAANVVVKGAMNLGTNGTISAASGLTTKYKIFYVHDAVTLGKDSVIAATIHAPNGTITASEGTHLTGALVARDIRVGRGSSLTVRNGFRNVAPVANPQTVSTNGTTPLAITLTGSDADGDPLTFSIVTPPSNGTLSAITQTGPTSATVTYTPAFADPDDGFIFRVTDSEGATGEALVSINGGRPSGTPTVTVDDGSSDVFVNEATTLGLNGTASNGATLTFSIVGSGPSHGTLGSITQPSSPGAPATVVYTPAQDYTGPDSFQFQGCITFSGNPICDGGTFSINVAARTEPTNIAPDLHVTAVATTSLSFELPTAEARTFRVLSLPSSGTLRDGNGAPITSVPYSLPSNQLTFDAPATVGTVSFTYEATAGETVDTGIVTISILAATCANDPRFCDDGR